MSAGGGAGTALYSALVKDALVVSVNPTDTVMDSFVSSAGQTGVVWQVTNGDGSQTLSCRIETRESPTAGWAQNQYADELQTVAAGVTAKALWRFMANEARLVGTASGAGLSATVYRRVVYGVQPT